MPNARADETAITAKHSLVERSSLARLHLRHEIRMLRGQVEVRTAPYRRIYPAARFAAGIALSLAGLARGARLLTWMRRGVVAANVSVALIAFIASRVRNRTDAARCLPQHRASTGEST